MKSTHFPLPTEDAVAILPSDYPDPSIVRVGAEFFLTNSFNDYAPGLLIWRSPDLLHWTPIAHALPDYLLALGLGPDGVVLRYKKQVICCSQDPATSVTLKIVNDHHETDLWFKIGKGNWQKAPHGFDISGWNHNTLGGFLGFRAGLYAAGSGEAAFRDFKYRPLKYQSISVRPAVTSSYATG